MSRTTPLVDVFRFVSHQLLGWASADHVRAGMRRRPAQAWLVEPLEGRVVPAPILVTSLADAGAGTFRAAIQQANFDRAQDTITFAPSVTGTITLTSALPDLSTNMVIDGPGASALTVARSSADGTPAFRIFTVDADTMVAISGLTISGGSDPSGGGLNNAGTLTLTNCTISGNDLNDFTNGVSPSGGGIYNSGALTIDNSTVSGNHAFEFFLSPFPFSNGEGGGISNNGTLTVLSSTLSDNASVDGGGIFSSGTLTVVNSTISGNSASNSDGGGISSSGTLTVVNSTISGNSAGFGGGIGNSGTLSVTDSTISGNSATGNTGFHFSNPGFGGGINNSGTLTVSDSTISGNSTSFESFGVSGEGGGIANEGTLSVINSTISGNSTGNGGGISNGGTLSLTNCTLSGNSASTSSGFEGVGNGGGIDDVGTLTLTYCTVSDNLAFVGGGVHIDGEGGPVAKVTAITSLFDNLAGGNLAVAADAAFVSLGHNLFSDKPAVALTPTDLIDTDPLLGPLANNGGPTFTQALLPGSPAINAGVAVPGVTTDQRGVFRPQGSAPDIGAFELQLPPKVLGVVRHGVHYQPTTLVITFNHPMDPARAQNLANYSLVLLYRTAIETQAI